MPRVLHPPQTVAVRDPSSAQAKVYNNNVECVPASVVLTLGAPCLTCSPLPPLARLAACLPRSWTQAGGGFELWKEAFDGPALPMILSAVAGNGTQMLSTVTFDLDMVTGGSSLLNHEGNGYDTYNENLYYLGTLPIGTANETDGTWQIATAYDPGAPISFKSYSCESFTVTELCSAIPPPPPPRAPPAPRVKATAYVYYQGNVTATAPRDVVALGPGARRHLLQAPAFSDFALADIARRPRAIMNDLENVPTDLAVFWAGALVVLAGAVGGTCVAEALALTVLLPTYVGARVAFTYCYLAARQPYRTIFFVLGMCAVVSAAGVLVSAAAKVAAL